MEDLFFTGMNIPKDTRWLLDRVTPIVCEKMTDSEKKAYEIGVENTLRAMVAMLETTDEPIIYMPWLEISEEMTLDEVREHFWKE